MSINLGNVLVLLPLLLLLLSVVVVGGIPSAAGQNTFLNITASDIGDLVGNVTDFKEENPVGKVTENVIERGGGGEEEGNDSSSSSSLPLVNDDDDDNNNDSSDMSSSLSVTTGDTTTIMINEVELNPTGDNDQGKEWIELYNPSDGDINISNFEIRTSSKSATIKLTPDAVIEAGETYVIELDSDMLSNTAESLILADATGNIIDRTPSLVDSSHDERTWQRIPMATTSGSL
jgi:hypothetical protein